MVLFVADDLIVLVTFPGKQYYITGAELSIAQPIASILSHITVYGFACL